MIDVYLELLIKRQNLDADIKQMSLFSRDDYLNMLHQVLMVYKNNPDLTLDEMRNILYQKAGIDTIVDDLVYKKNIIPGFVCSYGTPEHRETIVVGNKSEVALKNGKVVENTQKMEIDTIFDLASVTKLFTSLSILKLVDKNEIKLSDPITKYAPEFKNLNGVTIFDLLSFRVPLKTDKRIDNTSSRNEAEYVLHNISINENLRPHTYTDMGAMVLKYVIENVSGKTYYDFLNSEILSEAQMNNTNIRYDDPLRIAQTGLDYKITKKGIILNKKYNDGLPYDQKAVAMGQKDGNLSGHAGLFSNAEDMIKLSKALIKNKVISKPLLTEMAKNRLDYDSTPSMIWGSNQTYGYLVYSKNPNHKYTEVEHFLSGRSFASYGWTGCKLVVDPENKIYTFFGSNRSHNRVTGIDKDVKDKIIRHDNRIILPNGKEIVDATRFAFEKDQIIDAITRLTFQYKMLEDINDYLTFDKVEKSVKVRSL